MKRNRAVRALFVALLSLVLFELVLQASALYVAKTYDPPQLTEPEPGGRAVLCVGDAWTASAGASDRDHAYPAQLEKLLRERRSREYWAAVDRSAPTRSSRDVLEALPADLGQVRPRFVSVLVGVNDPWRRPELLEFADFAAAARGDERFRLRWRTAGFVRWLASALAGHSDPAPVAVDERAFPPPPVPGPADQPPARPADPDAAAARAAAWQAYRSNDYAAAAQSFAATLQHDPTDSESMKILTECYVRLGRAPQARQTALRLEQLYHAHPAPWVAADMLRALQHVGAKARAAERAKEVLGRIPDLPQAQALVGWTAFEAGDVEAAAKALDAATASRRYVDPVQRARWYDLRAVVYGLGRSDADESVRSVFQAYLLGRGRPQALAALRRFPDLYTPDVVARVLAGMDVGGATRELLSGLAAEALGTDRDTACRVLESHLRQIVACCRAAGAVPLLLTYPVSLPWHADLVERLGRELDVEVVPLHEVFAERLRGGATKRSLFALDGHPNDDGCGLMAEAVADRVLPR